VSADTFVMRGTNAAGAAVGVGACSRIARAIMFSAWLEAWAVLAMCAY
jgi:hypothetical protein